MIQKCREKAEEAAKRSLFLSGYIQLVAITSGDCAVDHDLPHRRRWSRPDPDAAELH